MEVLGCHEEEAEQRDASAAAGPHHEGSDSAEVHLGALAAAPLEAGANSPACSGPGTSAAAGAEAEVSAPAELPHVTAHGEPVPKTRAAAEVEAGASSPARLEPSTGAAAAPEAETGALSGGVGAPRTLAAFIQHCGVDFAARTVTERAQRGGMADESGFVRN